MLHLQSIGKSVCTQDIIDYLDRPENSVHLGIKKSISLMTLLDVTPGLLLEMGAAGTIHRWTWAQGCCSLLEQHFLPVWTRYQCYMWKWKIGDITMEDLSEVESSGQHTVMWFHDESTFYVNDQRKMCWVHDSESALPQQKGEGASLMVTDFVSADYGWHGSWDGKESTRVLFKAGRVQDGYFIN